MCYDSRKENKSRSGKMEQYNILIVEDDKEIRDGIEIFLKSQNYNVFKAADGAGDRRHHDAAHGRRYNDHEAAGKI